MQSFETTPPETIAQEAINPPAINPTAAPVPTTTTTSHAATPGEPDFDDGYYNLAEKAIYERPKPKPDSAAIDFLWQRGGLLGSGGFGKVFMGLNLDTGELVAVKQIMLIGDVQQRGKEVSILLFHFMLSRARLPPYAL